MLSKASNQSTISPALKNPKIQFFLLTAKNGQNRQKTPKIPSKLSLSPK